MKTQITDIENRTEALKNKALLNADAMTNAAHEFIDRAADRLSKSEDKLRTTAAATRKTLATSLDGAKTRLAQTNKATQTYVQRYPLRAVGIALGIGAVLTLLFRSKPSAPQ